MFLSRDALAESTLEQAKTNGMQETLQNYIRDNENIIDICVYEQEWINPTKEFWKGQFLQRAVVTHVHNGDLPIGTKLEYCHLVEESPKIFKNFRTVVEGELRTFFFSSDDAKRKDGILFIEGDAHWGFQRVGDVFADLFTLELATNPKLKLKIEHGPGYQSCVRIFDGKTFTGWEADASTWSIADGVMRGTGGTSRLAFTKEDYGSFRLIFTARMNPVNKDHLGVLFWGDRPPDAAKPKIDNAGWIQFMPPHGAMWDYHPPKHHNLKHETLAAGSKDFTKWSTTELLCNLDKGTMRAAVDGVEIVRYTHPHPAERKDPEKRIIAGPIGLFRHGGGTSEYKDIWLEANPKEDRLITVK